uniref:Uncharacterized protein n=1 Tax=Tanacetum cinerariifolium TaxID=118510 RepID=A0A699IX04_TANCI|nr:hypothetical protein [Tanacetum cinerariifolium]
MIRMSDNILEEDMPPRRKFVLTAPPPGYDVAHSSAAAAARAPRGQYDFFDTVEAGQEFGDCYKAPPKEIGKGPASESSARNKGRTIAITIKDMQKRRNDVKARTTLLVALPDEH